jgi:uncharacterized protein YoxC
MIIEICVIVATAIFAILAFFCVMFFLSARKTLKATFLTLLEMQSSLNLLTKESLNLLHNTNHLTLDICKKSESLDFIFHGLARIGENKLKQWQTSHQKQDTSDKFAKAVEMLGCGIMLANKIKEGYQEYVKHR